MSTIWGYRLLPSSGLTEGATPFSFNGIAVEGKIFDGDVERGWGELGDVLSGKKPEPIRAPVEELRRDEPTPQAAGDIEQLRERVRALGINVDLRWREKKLMAIIEAARPE